jgi:hypothetical protein
MERNCSMLLGGKILLEGSGIRLVVAVKVSLKLAAGHAKTWATTR